MPEAFDKLAEAARSARAGARMAAALRRQRDLDGTITTALTEIVEVVDGRAGHVFLADERRRELRLVGRGHLPDGFAERLAMVPFDAPLVAARSARTRCLEVAASVQLDAALPEAALVRTAGGLLVAVPLLAATELVGVLAFALADRPPLEAEERDVLSAIGDLTALALASALRVERPERCEHIPDLAAVHSTLEVILDRVQHAIIFVERGGGRVIANPRAIELTGHDLPHIRLDEFRGEVRSVQGEPLAREDLPVRRALAGQSLVEQELILVRPDGQEFHTVGSAFPVRDARGAILGAIVEFEDITACKRHEQLRQDWTRAIAHDLKQPVNVIMLQLEMLLRHAAQPASTGPGAKALTHIQTSAKSLAKLVDDLAEAASTDLRTVALHRTPVDLAALASDVADRQELVDPSHPVRCERVGEVPLVSADAGRLEQVLSNLLSNARKYAFARTEIRVRVEPRDDGVMVTVENRGPGITAEELPRIFDRYYRAERARRGGAPGLGVGLYIAKCLVEAHGGRIWAQSTPGETTALEFVIPRAPQAWPAAAN